MARIELPNDGWADLRDVDEIPERVRRPLLKQLAKIMESPVGAALAIAELVKSDQDVPADLSEKAGTVDEDALDPLNAFNDEMIVAFVAQWSYDLPVEVGSLLDIPAKAYDALMKATPNLKDLMPDFAPAPDEDSPTGPSSA